MNKKPGSISLDDIDKIHKTQQEHILDGDVAACNGIIVFLDVLGWKKTISENDIPTYFKLIDNLRTDILDNCLRSADGNVEQNVKIINLSDSLVICIDNTFPFCEINIFHVVSRFITNALEKNFAFRGAISRGKYFTNKLGNVFVGDAFYEAAHFSEATDWAGVIITNSLSRALLEKNDILSLTKLSIISYNAIPFKDKFYTEHNLVLLPFNKQTFSSNSGEVSYTDFKGLYEMKMAGDDIAKTKLANTKKFFDYLDNNNWFREIKQGK